MGAFVRAFAKRPYIVYSKSDHFPKAEAFGKAEGRQEAHEVAGIGVGAPGSLRGGLVDRRQ